MSHAQMMKLLVASLLLPLLAACGDEGSTSGDGSTAAFDSGADEGAALSSLDEGEREALCASLQRHYSASLPEEGLRRAGCTVVVRLLGASSDEALSPAMCEEAVAECASEAMVPEASCSPTLLGTCDATVAEFEACAQSRIETTQRVIRELTCSTPEASLPGLLTTPEACQALEERCPDLSGECTPCDVPTICGEDGWLYCDACDLEQWGVEPAADPATCSGNNSSGNNNPGCDERCPEPSWCGEDGNFYCSEDEAACYGVLGGSATDTAACEVPPEAIYRFVLIEDASPVGDASAPGAQIDAIGVGLLPSGEIAHWATSVEDFNIGGAGNDFSDVAELLGVPDAGCELQNVTALGGAEDGGYVIVGFGGAEDVTFASGMPVVVEELGPTSCPDQDGWVDNEVMVSVSSSADRGTFLLVGTISEGSNAVTIP